MLGLTRGRQSAGSGSGGSRCRPPEGHKPYADLAGILACVTLIVLACVMLRHKSCPAHDIKASLTRSEAE